MKYKKLLILATFFFIFQLLPSTVHANQGTSGAEIIMQEIGADLPKEWNSWNRTKKFDFLQSIGIYPNEKNGKYQGNAGDLTEYFSLLKLEIPQNWESMSFVEKQSYIAESSNTEMLNKILENPEQIQNTTKQEEIPKNEQNQSLSTQDIKQQTSDIPNNEKQEKKDTRTLIFVVGFLMLLFPSIKYRKISSKVIYYGIPIILAGISILNPTKDNFNLIGTLSKLLIMFILFIKPIAALTKSKQLNRIIGFRRQLGVFSFWLFTSHFIGMIYMLKLFDIADFTPQYLIFGLIAGLCMLIAALTSNNHSIKKFKKHWKTIQYSVYIAFFALLAHTSIIEHGDFSELYVFGSIFAILKLAEWIVQKQRKNLKKHS